MSTRYIIVNLNEEEDECVYLRMFCKHVPGRGGEETPVFSNLFEDAAIYSEEEVFPLAESIEKEHDLEVEVWALDGLNFEEALSYLKEGRKLTREGWNGKDQYIQLSKLTTYQDYDGPHKLAGKSIVFHGTLGVQVGWLASQGDLLAEDWVVLQ